MKHPNILPYKECFVQQDKGLVILIMEYCECKFFALIIFLAGDLAGQIAEMNRTQQPFSEPQIMSWLNQICSALAYLESINIIHHNLKPENIFIIGD
jgi:serine/threonine protein kinase